MTAVTADTAFFSGRKIVVRIVGVVAALGLVAACTNDRGQPTNQTTGTVMGAALGGVVGKPVLYFAINRNAVVVIKNDELGQAQRARKRTDFVRNAFHQTTITHKRVGVVVNNCVLGAVELSGQQGLGQRHAHCIGQTLAQRARRGFNTWRDADFRVARRF